MSFVTTQPDALTIAASQLHHAGLAMGAQNAAAAPSTTGVVPAAADLVSALTATQFCAQAAMYQAVGVQATAVHELVVTTLGASARSYAATEAANTITTS